MLTCYDVLLMHHHLNRFHFTGTICQSLSTSYLYICRTVFCLPLNRVQREKRTCRPNGSSHLLCPYWSIDWCKDNVAYTSRYTSNIKDALWLNGDGVIVSFRFLSILTDRKFRRGKWAPTRIGGRGAYPWWCHHAGLLWQPMCHNWSIYWRRLVSIR